jgi:hypothetical protein
MHYPDALRGGGSAARVSEPLPRVSVGDLPRVPDAVAAWFRLDLLIRRIVWRRMELRSTPETD